MRLNKFDKDAFVTAAMDDVPKVDHDVLAKKLVVDCLKASVPVDIQNMIAKYPDWFGAEHVIMPPNICDFYTVLTPRRIRWEDVVTDPKDVAKMQELAAAAKAQYQSRIVLEGNLRSTIEGFSTLKSALAALPEFAKYLPEERDGKVNRSMPAVANLVTTMMQAGWPKEKKDGKKTNQ